MKPSISSSAERCLYAYALLGLLFFCRAQAQTWESLGPDDNNQASFSRAYYISLALNSSGVPHIVFQDSMANGKATVRKFNGSFWSNVGSVGFSAGRVTYTSIAIDRSGTPYVVYKDAGNNNKATVKKFNGSTWINVGTEGLSAGTANYTRIAIDGNATPYVVYQDEVNNNKVTVKKFDGSSWVTVGTAGFSAGTAAYTFLAINRDNTPYVIYQDGGNNNYATVKKFDGSNWTDVGTAGFSGRTAAYTSLVFDSSGIPYVVYQGGEGDNSSAVKKFSGNTWTNVGNISPGANPSIAIDGNGAPYLAWGGLGYPNLLKFNGTFLITVLVTNIEDSSPRVIDQTSIAIDANDTVYLAYQDDFPGKAIVKKVTEPNKWVIAGTLGIIPANATYLSMAIGNNGAPYVLYRESLYSYTYLMKFDGTAWTRVGSTVFGRTPTTPAIAIGPGDTPYAVTFLPLLSLVVRKFNGNNWVTVGNFTGASGYSWSIAINKNGTPYVAFADAANSDKATVVLFNGSAWVNVGTAGFSAGRASSIAFAIDSADTPYIAYRDEANNGKTTVKKLNGNNWIDVGASAFSAGAANTISLAFDTSGKPYVAYIDQANGNKATLQKFNGSSWEYVGTAGFSAGPVTGISLTINHYGTPYVSYVDSTNNNRAAVMQFNGSNWVNISGAGLSTAPVEKTHIGIGTHGVPVVTYGSRDAFARSFISFPMRLSQFRGALLNKTVHLRWKMEGAENESAFIVQRSVDGRNFSDIATVTGRNIIGSHLKFPGRYYYFIDHNIASLNTAILYYRLKQNDTQGNITLSEILIIAASVPHVYFFPNPFNRQGYVRITTNTPQQVQVRIFDYAGRVRLSQQVAITAGTTTLSIDISSLNKGIYFLDIKGSIINNQLIIQKQ